MNYKKLLISLVAPFIAGAIGSYFTAPAIPTWHTNLIKPHFNPPNWVFGPVWTGLYILMGIAVYLVWNKGAKRPVNLFWAHLVLNATWSIAFFGMQNPGLAFINIIVLLLMIVLLINKFHKIDKRASLLMIPYFFWVSFATILNYYIWVLN